MNNYTFLAEIRKATEEDFYHTGKLGEEIFQTKNDPSQQQISKKRLEELAKSFAEGMNIIYHDKEIVGFTHLQPATITDMNEFLKGSITEEELTQKALEKQLTIEQAEAIYLVAAVIKEPHRRKGLAQKAYTQTINKYVPKDALLFAWTYTREGEIFTKKLEQTIKRKIYRAQQKE